MKNRIHMDNENLDVLVSGVSDSSVQVITTVGSFGADNRVYVDGCDGRPESTIEGKPQFTAVRMAVVSDYDGDDGYQRVRHTVCLTANEALRLAQDLISQASGLIKEVK